MAKYRLSYLKNGGFVSLDLTKLDCLKNNNVTDIEIIDKFTSKFETNVDLNKFLIKNNILDEKLHNVKLQITVDKKVDKTKITYNKPIYNSDKLILKGDSQKLTSSFGVRTIKNYIKNGNYMQLLAINYQEKYQNAYNRIDGSSKILGCINYIEAISNKFKKNEYLTPSEFKEYDECIEFLIEKEFFKTNTKNKRTVNYRGLHDFIVLDDQIKEKLNLTSEQKKYQAINEEEEFLTKEDFDRVNCSIFGLQSPYDVNKLPNNERSDFKSLQESAKKYIKKLDGDC